MQLTRATESRTPSCPLDRARTLPKDVINFALMPMFNNSEQRELSKVNKLFCQRVQETRVSHTPIFYAVGRNIALSDIQTEDVYRFDSELFDNLRKLPYQSIPPSSMSTNPITGDYFYSSSSLHSSYSSYYSNLYKACNRRVGTREVRVPRTILQTEVQNSLPAVTPLFFSLSDAQKYAAKTNIADIQKAAIFEVQAARTDAMKLKCAGFDLNDGTVVPGFYTPQENLPIIYSVNFSDKELKYDNKKTHEFSKTWIKGIHKEENEVVAIKKQIISLFKSYSPWYARFTRHFNKEVKLIIDTISKAPSLNTMHNFLSKEYMKALEIKGINKDGHFCKMLHFSILKLRNQIKKS